MNNMFVVAWKISDPKLHCVLDIINKPYQKNGNILIKAYYKSHYLQYCPPYQRLNRTQFESITGERLDYP